MKPNNLILSELEVYETIESLFCLSSMCRQVQVCEYQLLCVCAAQRHLLNHSRAFSNRLAIIFSCAWSCPLFSV